VNNFVCKLAVAKTFLNFVVLRTTGIDFLKKRGCAQDNILATSPNLASQTSGGDYSSNGFFNGSGLTLSIRMKTVETRRAKLRALKGGNVLPSDTTTRTMLRIVCAAQPISRVDLARRLNVPRGTVTDIVKPLLAAGVLREGAPDGGGRVGRPPIGLSFRSDDVFSSE
jgi:hypothetical protein